jgi:hypothetical protein
VDPPSTRSEYRSRAASSKPDQATPRYSRCLVKPSGLAPHRGRPGTPRRPSPVCCRGSVSPLTQESRSVLPGGQHAVRCKDTGGQPHRPPPSPDPHLTPPRRPPGWAAAKFPNHRVSGNARVERRIGRPKMRACFGWADRKRIGAGGGNRTLMEQAPRDFESRASTSFTTPALVRHLFKPAYRACQGELGTGNTAPGILRMAEQTILGGGGARRDLGVQTRRIGRP